MSVYTFDLYWSFIRALFLFNKNDATAHYSILLLDSRGQKKKYRCHIITFVSQHLSLVLANQTGAPEIRP